MIPFDLALAELKKVNNRNMREIKFRAWDKAGEYFKPLDDDGDYYFRDDGDGLCLYDKWGECKNTILMQFTGLKDKNGKEIYEGDVLEQKDIHGYEKGVVEYRLDSFDVIWSDGASHSKILKNNAPSSKIIGNIYEHPELITTVPQ